MSIYNVHSRHDSRVPRVVIRVVTFVPVDPEPSMEDSRICADNQY